MKDRADDGKAPRGEKSPANPLNEPGGNKQLNRGAAAHSAEAATKTAVPKVNTRRRP